MKLLAALFVAASVGFLPACAQLGLVAPQTLDQRIVAGYITVKGVLDTSLVLLKAKKISPEDAKGIIAQADLAKESLDLARELMLIDTSASENKAVMALNIITALEAYLEKKKGAK